MKILQSDVRNRLLRAFSVSDFSDLASHFHKVQVFAGMVLISSNTQIDNLYFPEVGLISITIGNTSHDKVEIGMIGREGLVGASPVLLGVDRSPYEFFVQVPGEMIRVSTSALQAVVAQSPSLQALLLRYVQTLIVQTAQTAFANALYTIDIRLARWLLMYHDRGEGNDLFVTHEFLAIMLGVRRPGVSVAIQVLEGNRLIKATRRNIRVLDRPGLEAVAQQGYGLAEAEYARLFGGGFR